MKEEEAKSFKGAEVVVCSDSTKNLKESLEMCSKHSIHENVVAECLIIKKKEKKLKTARPETMQIYYEAIDS